MSSNLIYLPPKMGEVDPFWDKVVLLMHMDGANGSTVFKDEKNHVLSGGTGTKISTERSKFGGASFKSLDGNYLSGTHADFAFGKGDFTMEMWVYNTQRGPSNLYGISGILSFGPPGGITGVGFAINSTGLVYASAYGGTMVTGTESIPLNAWSHLALSRVNGVAYLFVNGKLAGSAANDWDLTATNINIGYGYYGYIASYFIGYIDEVRLTKGKGRYTASFAPATAAFSHS